MDNWQSHIYKKVSAFTGFEYEENETTISLNQREAYIVMKALEDQQKYRRLDLYSGHNDFSGLVKAVGKIKE